MLQALRHFMAIDQTALEHFLAASVLSLAGVVEDFLGLVTCLDASVPVPKQGKSLFALTVVENMNRLSS